MKLWNQAKDQNHLFKLFKPDDLPFHLPKGESHPVPKGLHRRWQSQVPYEERPMEKYHKSAGSKAT